MRFWLRELAGWLLVVLGLLAFFECFVLLVNHFITEAGPLVVVGIFVFRGGIHLLKTAIAARVCLHANAQMLQREPAPERAKNRPGHGSPPRPVSARS
jgi:hypothetical protein